MKGLAGQVGRRAMIIWRCAPPVWTYIALNPAVSGAWNLVLFGCCAIWAVGVGQRKRRRRAEVMTGTKPLPQRRTTEPIKATKLAYPVVKDGRVLWHALYRATTYGNDEEATCHIVELLKNEQSVVVRVLLGVDTMVVAGEHGPPPHLRCRCGFYALKPGEQRSALTRWVMSTVTGWRRRRRKMEPQGVYALLDVELMGRVISYTRGYRAERQRVMKARLDGRCVTCGKAAKGFFAGTFVVGPRSSAAVISTCGCQVPVRWDLQDIRNMAGTEVEWDRARQPLLTHLRRKA